MKIGFYSPYLDTTGGGERYMLALADHWAKKHNVTVFWDDTNILSEKRQLFNLKLSNVLVLPNVFAAGRIIERLLTTSKLDILFVLSDGSLPVTFAKRNILHLQLPLANLNIPSWKRRIYQAVVVNSFFTKDNLDPSLSKESLVIYPPVNIGNISTGKKERLIISVGRFSGNPETKKHSLLIKAFNRIHKDRSVKGWKLIIAGSLKDEDKKYFANLQDKTSDLPVELYPNCPYDLLLKFYREASIYWHAAGFGESEPKNMEHFGISTVEAMAAGAVPVVYRGGGQPEIVRQNVDGFLWKTPDELARYTIQLASDSELMRSMRLSSRNRSKEFDVKVFNKSFDTLLDRLIV